MEKIAPPLEKILGAPLLLSLEVIENQTYVKACIEAIMAPN